MRLIDIKTFELKFFSDNAIPAYITLSHRWLDDKDEVAFEEYPSQLGLYKQAKAIKKGFEKILKLCEFVRGIKWVPPDDAVEYVWVDTCCIDKRSSSELSESINSMARWYRDARLCVAFLQDVPAGGGGPAVWNSEWFTRGWCLQELLFPDEIVFCDKHWNAIGKKSEEWFRQQLSKKTGIDVECLKDRKLMLKQCVAKKMSWASQRVTKRTEDMAYCLLGLFNIQMALLYGEGMNAFARLQEEIVRQTDDESVFAWTLPGLDAKAHKREWGNWATKKDSILIPSPSVLAPHPRYFERCGSAHLVGNMRRAPYRITNKGLEFESQSLEVTNESFGARKVIVVELNCGNVVDTVDGRKEDRSCLLVLGETKMGRYTRLELDPRKAAKGLKGDEYMWRTISFDLSEKTILKKVGGSLFYIQAISSAKGLGAQGYADKDGRFLTLTKALDERKNFSQQSESHLGAARDERGRSSSQSSQPGRNLGVRMDVGHGRSSSHSPQPSRDAKWNNGHSK